MKNKKWLGLKKGDIVDVIAPGWATDREALKKAEIFLKSWGLKARIPPQIYKASFLGSNTPEVRFKHLKKALQATDSKIIWCLRGGYGSLHLLEELQKLKEPKLVKLIIGISDITSLHSFLNSKWNWPSMHGPLLDRVARGKLSLKDEREFKNILFGEQDLVEFNKLKALNSAAQKNKTIRSTVVGGNLTVLQSLIGTPSQISLKNKILFVEDIGERAYRIDRELEHLWQCGELKHIKALIFGDFLGCEEKNGKTLVPKLMKIWAERLKVPVLYKMEAGHGDIQRPVPFATPCVLQLGVKIKLSIKTGIQ